LRWSPENGNLFGYVIRAAKDELGRLGQWFTDETLLENLLRRDAKWAFRELVKRHHVEDGHVFGTINDLADLGTAVWKQYRNTPGIR
jgi:hypothetical protein